MIEIEHQWQTLLPLAIAMAAVHMAFPRFDRLMQAREALWMGLIGGIAAGYLIIYLLPKLGRIAAGATGLDPFATLSFGDLWVYLLLLAGMISYLVMLHLDQTPASPAAAFFDYLTHGAYSFLLGYVFVESASAYLAITLLMAVVFSLHLLGMDHLYRSVRPADFDHKGRWAFSLLLVSGAFAGLVSELDKSIVNALTAFLAGIILVNVIAEEIPRRQRSRMPYFMLGVGLFLVTTFLVLSMDQRPAYPAY